MWFLAQEMRLSTVRGVSCLVSRPMRRMICFTMAAWSFSSKIAKERVRPSPLTFSASMSRRRMRTQSEWNVEMSGLATRGVADQALDALGHLGGGLVGEGDGQDGIGRDALFLDQPGDAAGDDAGLAGAGAGEDQQGALRGLHGGALFGIQFGDERLRQERRPAGRVLL